MKKIFYILTAALLLTGCTVDDTAIDNNAAKTVTFTATLAPKGGATTRAITTGTEGGKEVLTTAWKSGEKIAIYYQKTNGDYDKATATVGTPNADGSAPITATLTGALDGGTVKFVYPASLMDKYGDIKWSSIRIYQKGYLTTPETGGGSGQGSGQGQSTVDLSSINTISNNFDLATATGTIAVTGTEASVSGKVKMENQVCICKFNILLPIFSVVSTVTHYDITIDFDGGETYQLNEIPKERLNELYVAMRPVSSTLATITAKGYISSGNGISSSSPTILSTHSKVINSVTLAAGKFYRNVHATLLSNILTPVTGKVSLTAGTGELLVGDGSTVSGTGGANTRLKIADGATVTLSGVTNTGITKNEDIPGIECLGDATIILEGENSVRGREYAPGIFVPEGMTLTIMGSGTLVATGGNTSSTAPGFANIGGAGIGGTRDVSCGNIVIKGGTITATGTGNCAGIGSGDADGANITCGDITITGGTVTATGGSEAAGIGSGHAYQANTTCGNITISGGAVTATGSDNAAGIGSGYAKQANTTCGNITISGGTVTATGGKRAAGIGSGDNDTGTNTCGAITITGGMVTATGGLWAAGIGSGHANQASNTCGAITISGGTVTATGGERAAGIGSGNCGRFASISIGSGIIRVTATRSNYFDNVPIGKGFDDQGSGAVTFDGVTMHDGRNVYRNPSDWIYWPETGGPFGGIQVSAFAYGENGRTWTLTPAP